MITAAWSTMREAVSRRSSAPPDVPIVCRYYDVRGGSSSSDPSMDFRPGVSSHSPGRRSRPRSSGCLRPIACKPHVDATDDVVDGWQLHPDLTCHALHEAVDAFDVARAGCKRARGRRRSREPKRCMRVLLERHQVLVARAERLAHVADEAIDGTRCVEVRMHGVADRAHRVLLETAIV